MTETALKKALILGVGNLILGDEGFGVHVARRLKESGLPAGIDVTEGHVGGFDLLGLALLRLRRGLDAECGHESTQDY